MKKNYFSKIILSIALILLSIFSTQVFATDSNILDSEDINDIITSYETNYVYTSSDLFLYDTNIEISEIIDGNVFAYGSSVNVTGEVLGDLFVITNSLTISEDAIIYGNIFTYSSNITISGIVSDIYAISEDFTLEESGMIDRNLYLMSDATSLYGQIGRDTYISTENLNFGDSVEEIIKGNLNYTSTTDFEVPEGIVGGEINFTPIETETSSIILSVVSSIITTLIFSFVVIMLSVWLTPKFKDRACEIMSKKSLMAFGIGILVFILIIIISFIFIFFTYGFGISIAIALIALLVLAYAISNTIFSMALGKLIATKLNLNKNVAFVLFSLLIVLALKLIEYIPYIGTPINFIASIVGLGILCINAYKRNDLV